MTSSHTKSASAARLTQIKQTLADLEKHGHRCDWGRESDLKWCVGEIERMAESLREVLQYDPNPQAKHVARRGLGAFLSDEGRTP